MTEPPLSTAVVLLERLRQLGPERRRTPEGHRLAARAGALLSYELRSHPVTARSLARIALVGGATGARSEVHSTVCC